MKSKKIVFILVIEILLVLISIGIAYHFRDRRTYELDLPETESLTSIVLEQNAESKAISRFEEMDDILNVLNGVKRITQKDSIQDVPVNVENEIKIDFISEKRTSTIFVYKKAGKYYIEQPYNGIYQISTDEYNSIENNVAKY